MTPCNLWRDNLKSYADGELPLKTRLAVRFHLLRCGDCRMEINEMKDISNNLKANDAGTLDDALRTKILNSMPDAAPDVPNDLPPLKSGINRKKIPLYAFGTCATALVGWFVMYPALHGAKQADEAGETAVSQATQSARLSSSAPKAGGSDDAKMVSPGKVQAEPDRKTEDFSGSPDAAAKRDAVSARQVKRDAGSVAQVERDTVSPEQMAQANGGAKPEYLRSPAQAQRSGGSGGDGRAGGGSGGSISLEDTERKAHREGSLTLEVDNTETKSETISTLTKTAGGYVANDELRTEEDGTKTASLTLKVPVAQFESFIAQVSHLGDVKAKSLSGEDITEKTSDAEQEARVVGEDVKDLEAKLRRLRHAPRRDEETLRQLRIREAQAQARLKLLKNLAALADITVELREKPKPEPVKPQTGGFLNDLNETAHNAASNFAQAARLPIVLLVWGIVYLPLFLALLFAYRIVSRFWTRFTP